MSALAFTSALGCIAVLYTGCFIVCRCLDGSYRVGADTAAAAAAAAAKPVGRFLASLPDGLQPAFSRSSRWRMDAKALILMSNLGLAYIAHYNAPTFYRALDQPSTERFGQVCAMAFGILSLLYLVIMLMGYFTFGDVTVGNILRNYAESDPLAILGRVATFASILFGFPLAMLGLKDSLISLLHLPRRLIQPMTLGLLVVIATIAILVSDIGLIVGVSGALLGASIVYVFPSLIYIAARKLDLPSARGGAAPSAAAIEQATATNTALAAAAGEEAAAEVLEPPDGQLGSLEEALVFLLVPFGIFLGVLGVYMTLAG